MNKAKRDYCSKGRHPKWRAWVAKYNSDNINWPWIGNFCIYCGALVPDVIGDGAPRHQTLGRLRVLRNGAVSHSDYQAEQKRLDKYHENKRAVLDRIRAQRRAPNE